MNDEAPVNNSGVRIFKNIIVQGLTYGIRAASNFLIIVFIARMAGAENLGIYSFAITFTLAAAFLTDLGISLLLIREIARDRERENKYINNTLVLMFMLAPGVIVLFIVAVNLLAYSAEKTFAVYLSVIALILFSFTSVFKGAFFARERMEFWMVTIAIQEAVFLGLGLLVLSLQLPFISIFIVFMISRLLGLLVAGIIYQVKIAKLRVEFDWPFTRQLIWLALPFAAASILNLIYARSAILLLSNMQGDEATGYYEAAYNLSIRLVLLATMINVALLPSLSRLFKDQIEIFRSFVDQSVRFLLIFGIPIVFCFFFLADELIIFLYSEAFLPSVLVFKILLIAVLFKMVGNSYGSALTAADKQGFYAASNGIAAVLNLGMNIILIKSLSFIGAAIAAVATEIVLFLLFFFFAKKHTGTYFSLKWTFKPILASIPMIGLILLSGDFPVIVTILLALIIYTVIFILIGGLQNSEVVTIRMFITRVTKRHHLYHF